MFCSYWRDYNLIFVVIKTSVGYSTLQKLQDFKTILAAIHLLFKILLLCSSKRMCRIGSQLKKMICLKYLILETPYNFFSIFSWYFIVLHILNFLSPMFSGINNNNFSFFGFSNFSSFLFVFTTLIKKIFIFKYF